MHTYHIFYEPADTDEERRFLGIVTADSVSDALDKAAQYYEIPQHDLVAVLVSRPRGEE